MSWWSGNRLRLIQNNIMETDADLDTDKLLSCVRDFSANTLILNTGGISAFYPTELEFHHRSPYLKGDLIGEAIGKCHGAGIRFIARFDFSKADEDIFRKKPEWFFKSRDGRHISYNGTVLTCVNGGYQREYSLEILKEVMDRYPIDGVFFNMFGYQNWDYSGSYYGICCCDACRERFAGMYGCGLPEREDPQDPAFRRYQEFKRATVKDMLDRIHGLVKSKNSDIAISTYDEYKVDIVRKESNTELNRSYPFWLYSASENVKSVKDAWKDRIISNCCINAVGLDYRFMGVSPRQIEARLYESIASGSGLDFCIIGAFDGYPDRNNFNTVKGIYRFHGENEEYYGNLQSVAPLALIKPDGSAGPEQQQEYLGIFKMLKERHMLFDVLCQGNLRRGPRGPESYRAVIIPDIRVFTAEEARLVIKANAEGTAVIATNRSFSGNAGARGTLFGISRMEAVPDTRSSYVETADKRLFRSFADRDWVLIKDQFSKVSTGEDVLRLLPYISPGRFGPPEKCGGHRSTGWPGATLKRSGKGAGLFIPWQPGRLYHLHGYEDHRDLFADLLEEASGGCGFISTNAPSNVELFFDRCGQSRYLLQLLNLSGFNGTTFSKPVPVHGIDVVIRNAEQPGRIYSLTGERPVRFEYGAGGLVISPETLDAYEALVIEVPIESAI